MWIDKQEDAEAVVYNFDGRLGSMLLATGSSDSREWRDVNGEVWLCADPPVRHYLGEPKRDYIGKGTMYPVKHVMEPPCHGAKWGGQHGAIEDINTVL